MASYFWETSGLPHGHCCCCPLRVPSVHAYLARTREDNRLVRRRTCPSSVQHHSAQAGNKPSPASPLWRLTDQSDKKVVNGNNSGWNGHEKFFSVVASASCGVYLSETARREKCRVAALSMVLLCHQLPAFSFQAGGAWSPKMCSFEQYLLVSSCGLMSKWKEFLVKWSLAHIYIG